MSISSKKINVMIEDVFSSEEDTNFIENKALLIRLAKDIYAMESSLEAESTQKRAEEMKAKISFRADEFKI